MADQRSEEEVVHDIKSAIKTNAHNVAKKVNQSALNYMLKQKWVVDENAKKEIELFFLGKIPKVIADEVAKVLYVELGLDTPSTK